MYYIIYVKSSDRQTIFYYLSPEGDRSFSKAEALDPVDVDAAQFPQGLNLHQLVLFHGELPEVVGRVQGPGLRPSGPHNLKRIKR